MTAERAKTATYIIFFATGVATATWASRIPQVKAALGLDAADWGLVLLAMAAGSVTALPLSGNLVARLGPKLTVTIFSGLALLGLIGVGTGYLVGVTPVAVALFLFGFGLALWDVAMNVEAALVEHHLQRAIMPRFHAGFSVGTVAGAVLGAVAVALHVSVTIHLTVVAVALAFVVLPQLSHYLSVPAGRVVEGEAAPKFGVTQAWREPRTLLIGLFVLIFAFGEGTAIDWVGVGMIEDYDLSGFLGTLGLATFLTFMTLARWFGSRLLDRYGRVVVLRVLSVIMMAGVTLFAFAPVPAVAFVGVALWGIGASLGFPVGMSAGGDEVGKAAPRVSVIATVGYVSFLAGPPLIGLLGQQFTVVKGVLAVAALAPIAFLLAGRLVTPTDPKN